MVGGGIGGTAAAYYLRQEFGPGVNIDVFEPGTVGGRLATVKIGDHEYETGGSVIHPLNLHMKHFIEKLGTSQQVCCLHHVSGSDLNGLPESLFKEFLSAKTSLLKWPSSMGRS